MKSKLLKALNILANHVIERDTCPHCGNFYNNCCCEYGDDYDDEYYDEIIEKRKRG